MTFIHDFPDDYYVGLGKVTAAAATLEVMLAMVVVAGENTEEDYIELAGKVGVVRQRLEGLAERLGPQHEVSALCTQAAELLDLRNKYVHALVFESGPAEAPLMGLHHPRSRTDLEVPTADHWGNLASAITICAIRAVKVANDAADSSRTDDAS